MRNILKKMGVTPGEKRYIINELGVGYRMLAAHFSYHAGAAISTGLKVLAYFRPLSPYKSGAGLRVSRSLAPGNLCMPKYAPYD